ncbi:hypothetical protein [Butyrivibrio sp. INlla16]|uniref:hypothetical protein n=1 Tax=Butyrivibrio sp. INlla16 TaxID=1520807 RepID=UPI00087E709B|nr:hypothetical protein [Butyrivibrio sp. INlla16]SDB66277.1 hypothetical protein SAMN02910263_03823 [Butyrivibrio sp. INlla16]
MYSEIIKKNMENAPIKWWPKYAYHFTDIRNAVNILSLGRLYSRFNAEHYDMMKNDNANIPVPIFLFFDLEKLLEETKTQF